MKKESLGVGRRKTAVASVRLRKGTGKIDVNGTSLDSYFESELQRKTILDPIEILELSGNYDIII